MKNTKIEWCDSTWNPVTGCKHGCKYCYATHSLKTVGRNTQAHDPNSPLLCGQILPEDVVKKRAVKSCMEEQLRFCY